MKLKCISPYRNGAEAYAEGDTVEGTDEHCELLLRDAPGSFEVKKERKKAAPEDEAPDLSAMSTETASGLVAPDRRARGGEKR